MKNMFNGKFIQNMFRQVDSVVWDMMTGRVGFQGADGIVSIELTEQKDADGKGTGEFDAQVSVNPFEDFGMAVPAFAQSVPVGDINVGDMIYSSSQNKVLGWVVKITKGTDTRFELMKQDGTTSNWKPPKVQMLGFDSGVMVLRSLMNMLPGGGIQLGQMQNMMLPMMMMAGEDGVDFEKIMPMMLFSQMNVGGGGTDVSGAGGNMMQMMMMMQMMKGNKIGSSTGTPYFR